ncbi:MAG TPA: ABC transporter ATP-binding protein [Actinomycetota bacterium]
MAGETALGIRGLGVRLGDRDVLRDVSLDVPAGSWVCAVGPNGAGKTTLLHAVAGLVACEGEVELWGRPLGAYRRRERARLVALVPQQPVIPDAMSVWRYVSLGRTPHLGALGAESATDLQVVESVLERLELAWARERRLDTLSGGELQRVVLARALAQQAPLLLLDEPTTGLDLGHQIRVLELVDGLRREQGLTVLSTMHDLTLAGRFADRFALLSSGRLVARGARPDVLDAAVIAEHFGADVRVLGDGDVDWAVVPVSRRKDLS